MRGKIIHFVAYITLLAVVIIFAIFSIMTFINSVRISDQIAEFEKNRGKLDNITKSMEEIKTYYDKYYIGELPDGDKLEDSALSGFALGYGDKYGVYQSPSDSDEKQMEREETLYGIGVEVVYEENKGLYVVKVYKDSPADEAGILPGDYIVEADGTKATEVSSQEFISLIKGEKGTSVELEVEKGEGTENFDGLLSESGTIEGAEKNQIGLSIERDEVLTSSVDTEIMDGILYLKISKFTNYTDEEFKEAISSYVNSNSDKKIIIDLRNNSGGIADTAIDMIDYIVPSGLIAKFNGKEEYMNEEYYSDTFELDAEIVVLVNENSASASELFAKALQDFGKATIIGENTFGKGTVISTFEMRNGGTITLSTAEYRTKSNEKIEGIGVKPDIEIKMGDEDKAILYKLPLNDDIQFQAALRLLK